jgi:hypothetical protein
MVGKFLSHFYLFIYLFLVAGRGGCLGFCFLGVLGVAFFFPQMAPSLHPLLILDTPCPHCYGLYILGSLSKHLKSVHLPTSLVP